MLQTATTVTIQPNSIDNSLVLSCFETWSIIWFAVVAVTILILIVVLVAASKIIRLDSSVVRILKLTSR